MLKQKSLQKIDRNQFLEMWIIILASVFAFGLFGYELNVGPPPQSPLNNEASENDDGELEEEFAKRASDSLKFPSFPYIPTSEVASAHDSVKISVKRPNGILEVVMVTDVSEDRQLYLVTPSGNIPLYQ